MMLVGWGAILKMFQIQQMPMLCWLAPFLILQSAVIHTSQFQKCFFDEDQQQEWKFCFLLYRIQQNNFQ